MKNILYVYAVGGTSLDFVLPRLAEHGRVFTLLLATPSDLGYQELRKWSCDVFDSGSIGSDIDKAVRTARAVRADAIVTFSEFAILLVSQTCQRLGLRGPGPNAFLARNKLEMRRRWKESNVIGPEFVVVRSVEDLRNANQLLGRPFVVKDAWGAGGIGMQIVRKGDDLSVVLETARRVLQEARRFGARELQIGED